MDAGLLQCTGFYLVTLFVMIVYSVLGESESEGVVSSLPSGLPPSALLNCFLIQVAIHYVLLPPLLRA